MSRVRTRFAPSPTGHLHVGGARTAIFNWLYARSQRGEMLLRIEDTDRERSTRESEAKVIEDLKALGIDWSQGPDIGGLAAPFRQSERLDRYKEVVESLVNNDLVYHCFCDEEILERKRRQSHDEGKPPHYDLTCFRLGGEEIDAALAAGKPRAFRFHVPQPGEDWPFDAEVTIHDMIRGEVTWKPDSLGDFIIMRADGMPTYNFSVVVDDHDMNITHVIRAEEHLTNTHRQVLISRALNWAPPEFAHVSLILGEDRSKLSKRHGSTSVASFLEGGILPEALFNYLTLLGWSHPDGKEIFSREEAGEVFDLARVNPAPAIFDVAKLEWMNGEYIRAAGLDDLATAILPMLESRGWIESTNDELMGWLRDAIDLVRTSTQRTVEIPRELEALILWEPKAVLTDPEVSEVLGAESTHVVVSCLAEDLDAYGPPATPDQFKEMSERVRDASGIKGKPLFMALRVALTGRGHGPELKSAVPLIARAAGTAGFRVESLSRRVSQIRDLAGIGEG